MMIIRVYGPMLNGDLIAALETPKGEWIEGVGSSASAALLALAQILRDKDIRP